jgi:hypothetical protein
MRIKISYEQIVNHKKMKITLFAIFSVNAEDLEAASSQAAPRFPVVSGNFGDIF